MAISDRWQQQWHSKHVVDETWCHLLDVSSRQVDSLQLNSVPLLPFCFHGISGVADWADSVSQHMLVNTLCAVGGGVKGIANLPWPCLLGSLHCSPC